MKKYLSTAILGIFLFLLIPTAANGANKWETLKTEHFTIFYKPGFERQAYEALQALEHYRPEVEKFTGNSRTNLPVVVNDLGIMANGQANSFLNWIQLFWYPPRVGSIGTIEDWNTLVSVHEYTHILQMTNSSRGPGVLTRLFGDIFSPNGMIPAWMIEGMAVYSESRLWDYQGRLNEGKYDAYIGARVADGRFPTILEATFETDEFQLDGIYTYGSVFLNYLANTYGEHKLTEFINVQGSSWASLDRNAMRVFGKPFTSLWQDWEKHETERFKKFYTDGEQITRDGWDLGQPLLVKNHQDLGRLYYQKQLSVKTDADSFFNVAEIREKDLLTLEEKVIVSTTSSFALPLKEFDNKLYYGVYEQKPGYANTRFQGFGGIALLREKDLISGEDRLVLSGEIRAYDLLPDGRILYVEARRDAFGSNVFLYSPMEGSQLLYQVDYLIDEIAVDGKQIVFAARESGRNTDLYLFTLATGELKQIFSTPYAEYGVFLNLDQIFFHANYEKVYSVYCYDLSTEKLYKITDGSYASYPAFDSQKNQLYFVGLNSYGFDLYRKDIVFEEYKLANYHPEVWPSYDLEGVEIKAGGYWDNLKTLAPKVTLPVFDADQDHLAVGVNFLGGDAIGTVPMYMTGITYDFKQQQWCLDTSFELSLFPPIGMLIGYNNAQQRPLYLDVSYPFIHSLTPGISGLTFGSTLSYGDGQGMEVTPYTVFGLQNSGAKATFTLQMPMENTWLGAKHRVGYYGGFMLKQRLFEGELTVKVNGAYDPDNPGQVFPKIRGYAEPISAKQGLQYTVEQSFPVLKVRKGSWPFGVYLEDLWSSFYIDAAVPTEGDYQLSTGVELYQEVKFDLGLLTLTISPGIGVGVNRNGDYAFHVVVKSSL